MRYFMAVEVGSASYWKGVQTLIAKRNAERKPGRVGGWEELFDASHTIAAKQSPTGEVLTVVVIEFDKRGMVTTTNHHAKPLRARLTTYQSLLLSSGDDAADDQYHLAVWFTGLGDASTHWAPAFCSVDQQPDAAMVRSDTYLYGKLFKVDPQSVVFGCREWAYQLYDGERPYIDVTNYVPKDEVFDKGTYIREFIGWARTNDHKPVIGKHEDYWYCLYDCPGGAKPGLIADIKAWTSANGWPVPKPPTKVPTFVDPPGKSGTYPR